MSAEQLTVEGCAPEVIVIGAGVTGIGVSYYLSKANIPHLVLEKSQELGGIWSSQRWPGIRCDSLIVKYSYSFRPFLSDQCLVSGQTIAQYLRDAARELGMSKKIRFGVDVARADYRSDEQMWRVQTNAGIFRARFLVNANGPFADEPHVPAFAGREQFRGKIVHLRELDRAERSVFEGKRILLVGSGASAISAVTDLHQASASLSLLQRSPSYIYETSNRPSWLVRLVQRTHRAGWKAPLHWVRAYLQLKDDLVFVVFRTWPRVGKLFFKRHWRKTISEEGYREHFNPPYNPWEQRIPVAIGLKKLIKEKQIEVATGEIETFTRQGVQLKNGRTLSFDLCVLATGYELQFFKFEVYVDGQKVKTGGINFYKGMMMGGIPNFFQPVGTLHTTWTQRTEVVASLMVKIIRHMKRRSLGSVAIERKDVAYRPALTANYIMRRWEDQPALYGAWELPSVDRLLFYGFRSRHYTFTPSVDSTRPVQDPTTTRQLQPSAQLP
jgi:cation diffusion facilitator CzcD-associated flavoprotein CzcO